MSKGLLTTIVSLVIILAFTPASTGSDLDEILQSIEDNVSKMSDMTATINQTVIMMGQNIVSTGKMYMKKPNLMKMVMDSPQKQTMVMDGVEKMMYIKMPTGQVMKQKMPDTGDSSNMNFKFDRESMEKDYKIEVLENTSGKAVLKMTPKDEKNTMVMTLTIDTEKGVIIKNTVKDEKSGIDMTTESTDLEKIDGKYWMAKMIVTKSKMGGSDMQTIMKYSDIKINQKLKDEEFKI